MKKTKLLILDGRHMLYRTADVFRTLGVEIDGTEYGTGGIYGFLSTALRVRNKWGGLVVVAWEGKNNFRYKLYPQYKAKGEPDEQHKLFLEDMNDQEARLYPILGAMGVRQYAADGGEADDVIGTIVDKMSGVGPIVIYTGDSDLRQFVHDERCIKAVSPGRRGVDGVYDEAAVYAKHKCRPDQLPALKALAGDTSDNIPGIKGVGEITAAALLEEYDCVADVVKAAQSGALNWPVAQRHQKIIAESAEMLKLYLRLTTIKRNVKLFQVSKPKRDKRALISAFKQYKFRTLLGPAELNGLMKMGDGA